MPNGVRGWEVGGTHRGRESLALASDQDRRTSAGAYATGDRWVVWGTREGRTMLGCRVGLVEGNA